MRNKVRAPIFVAFTLWRAPGRSTIMIHANMLYIMHGGMDYRYYYTAPEHMAISGKYALKERTGR